MARNTDCCICGKNIKIAFLSGEGALIHKEPIFQILVGDQRIGDILEATDYDAAMCFDCINQLEWLCGYRGGGKTYETPLSMSPVNYFEKNLAFTRNEKLNAIFKAKIEEVKSYIDNYNNAPVIIDKALNLIKTELDKMPPNRLKANNVEGSTFSADENCLYVMNYGSTYVANLEGFKFVAILNNSFSELHDLKCTAEEHIEKGDLLLIRIPRDKIVYYKQNGDVKYTTSVSGGGGESSVNVAGAVIGDMLLGTTGGIIGSQIGAGMKIDAISSEVNKHDDRWVTLKYEDENGNLKELNYNHSVLSIFDELIPEKQYDFVNLKKMPEIQEKKMSSTSVADEIRSYKSLLDEGIITQEEFDAKKKQLLGL